MIPKRIIIYPKDVQRITGRTERYGRKLLNQIKKELKKDDHQLVTIHDFADYTGIELEHIKPYLD
ncbi:MAG: hypothetical protein RIC35_15245 [Marinoscillum sp.]